jgi:DNA-binding NarL/FixJ family response regulator
MMRFFRKPKPVSSMRASLPRSEVIRRSRIAILDDEMPEVLPDLKNHGLSVDHISSTDDPNFGRLSEAFYDLLLLDYGGIGARFGQDEGLDVLRYLKRVNPSLRILAFTARTFDASKADFFRLCDGVVKKDAGIREALEQIEFNLCQIMTPAYQFSALTQTLGLTEEQQDELEEIVSKAVKKPLLQPKAIAAAKRFGKAGSEKLLEALVTKIVELGVAAAI